MRRKVIFAAALLLGATYGAAQQPEAGLLEELRALRQAVAVQQEHIHRLAEQVEQLQQERVAPPAQARLAPAVQQSKPAAASAASTGVDARVAALEETTAANQKSTEEKLKRIGPFDYSGDIRLRYEPFFGGTLATARHRTRFRLRFNALTKLSDEVSGGFSLASGDDLDPISTNQTFGSFFQRKGINIDRAFIAYAPKWAPGLELTGGKFAAPFYRTQLTLDDDTNVEGIAQSYTAKLENPVLKKLTFVAVQLPVRESSGGPDTALYGAQVGSEWRLGSRLQFTGYGAFYDWRNADPIRAAQTAGTLTGSSNTNAASASQFASKFGILDLIAKFDVDTGRARWPLMLQFNLANNTRACTNRLDPLVTPCNPRDRSAYWAEARLGRTREQGDLMFGYTFIRLERESVLAAFNFSDLRAPTNTATHRLALGYQVVRNVTMNYTALIGRQLVIATSPTPEPWLKRMQVDLSYRF